MKEFHIIIQMNIFKTWDSTSCSFLIFTKVYCHTITIIIDSTFKTKRKLHSYGQTTYIVKVSFFDVSANINNHLAFNLEKKKNPKCPVENNGSQGLNPQPHRGVRLVGEGNDYWGKCSSYNLNVYLK